MSKCAICRTEYERKYLTAKTCGAKECRGEQKRQESIKKAKRAEYKIAKEKQMNLSDHLAATQDIFNAYIRARDGKICISCGTTKPETQYCAGHYRTRKAANHLRFNEDNVHVQCNSYCNRFLSGNISAYRIALIAKIGVKRVEAIEHDQTIKRWTIDECKALKIHYRAMIKGLISGNVD